MTGLRKTPTCGISISTTSPGTIGPTPDGVPVMMTSAGQEREGVAQIGDELA